MAEAAAVNAVNAVIANSASAMRERAIAGMVVGEERAAAEAQRWTRLGLLLLAATVGVGLLWSVLVPLSSAVVGSGALKVDSSRKRIQHSEGGIVKAILVHDGSTVKAGDVLVRLDETRAGAAHGVVTSGRDVALAAIARLQAERDESPPSFSRPTCWRAPTPNRWPRS